MKMKDNYISLITMFLIVIALVGVTGCSGNHDNSVITKSDVNKDVEGIELEEYVEEKQGKEIEENIANNSSIEDNVLKGDFSAFEGNYMATLEHHDAYGGGKKLSFLTLNTDGSISGGNSYYSEGFYPTSKPIFIEKKEDGSYICKITEDCHYTLYPTGVIEDNEYVTEHQGYLKDTVYINCMVVDGGVLDVTYYLEKDIRSIESIIENYSGVDWVSIENYQEEIGETFISGTGIEYTVVEENSNNDSGRINIIVVSTGGQKRIITNIPAFQIDEKTGMGYYDIYEYVEN